MTAQTRHTEIPNYKNPLPLDRSRLPEPVLDGHDDWIELYDLAWAQAWDHVVHRDGAPASPYMDEGCSFEKVWIWDTCFMVHFCKYAPDVFPGIQSFDNFYAPIHDGTPTTLTIHHPDNPPLFAWIEYAYYLFTGDTARLEHVVRDKQYLQKHFAWLETLDEDYPIAGMKNSVCYWRREDAGYRWSGNPSGMDNTPRGRDDYGSIYWLDAAAQQGLSALYIAKIAEVLGDAELAAEYRGHYERLAKLLNEVYWDDADGIYYDVRADDPTVKVKVATPASYWPMLAEMCSDDQAAMLAKHADDAAMFATVCPWPSVARNDADFVPEGQYWRGGVWLPTAYMATKALEAYGYGKQADAGAERLIGHMVDTWKQYDPHTIWETYRPEEPAPATAKDNERIVRQDFCGWSALGPISMLIENVLGFYHVDAGEKLVCWRKHQTVRHGIRRLRFGDISTDIIADGDRIEVTSTGDYTLRVNGVDMAVTAGTQTLTL